MTMGELENNSGAILATSRNSNLPRVGGSKDGGRNLAKP